jgi:peptide/nickel transport system permease protein
MSFVVRRLISSIPVLFGILLITFFLIHLVPGDPVDMMLGEQASSADRQAMRANLGLDQPIVQQFTHFLSQLSHANLGRSLRDQQPVADLLKERLPATLELAFSAMLAALLIAIPLGVWAAIRKQTFIDHVLRLMSLLGTSSPSFWLGPLFVSLFALRLDWFPVSERGGVEHLILPVMTLATGLIAVLTQFTRAAMLEVIKEDYLRTARAKGVSPAKVYFRHALSNALMPLITVAGLQFGALLTGTVIIETIFDWPGLGTLLFQAIGQRDYPVVQACVMTIAFIYVLVNLLTDFAYAAANPKVRLE